MYKRLLVAGLIAFAIGAVDWTAPAAPQIASAAPASGGVLLFVKGSDVWSMKADGSYGVSEFTL